MSIPTTPRLALAGLLAAAAIGSAAPAAQAHRIDRCDGGAERLEQRFRQIEERRGYEAAVEWWDRAWTQYYERCLAP